MKKIILIFISTMCLFMSSCSKMEIDKTAIISSIYISNAEDDTQYQFNTVKNENETILKEYKTFNNSIDKAKEQLEKTSVSYLFLGQTECVILSEHINRTQINDLVRYFSSGYECSPDVRILFATEEAMNLIQKEEISTQRIVELSKLISEKDKNIAMNIYTFYNIEKQKGKGNAKVPLLYVNNQLDIKSIAYNELND